MFTKTRFIFDGIQSEVFNLVLVNLQTGTTNVPFVGSKSILEEKLVGSKTPYFYGVDQEPLTFSITIAREEPWDYETRVKVAQWLFQDEYKDFISTDHPGIVYTCMAIGSPEKILVGNIPRMITINFRCNSSTAWSPLICRYEDLSEITSPTIITMENKSNIEKYVYPEITVTAIDGGTIAVKNITDEGREFRIQNLLPNETIYINNKLREIESSVLSVYRLKDFNRNWFRLVQGVNQIQVTGKCVIKATMKYPMAV